MSTENILVIPTARFHDIGHFQGFCRDVDRYVARLLNNEQLAFRPRDQMEQDPSFKQLIPYVIFRHTPSTGSPRLFQYTRGSGQGEERLHELCSVGIGGHISDVDTTQGSTGGDIYAEGIRRELEEEVRIDTAYHESCVGLINDDQTPVGQVHLGVVHIFDVEQPAVSPREEDIADAAFRPVDEILRSLDRFETWSQIAVRALFG